MPKLDSLHVIMLLARFFFLYDTKQRGLISTLGCLRIRHIINFVKVHYEETSKNNKKAHVSLIPDTILLPKIWIKKLSDSNQHTIARLLKINFVYMFSQYYTRN